MTMVKGMGISVARKRAYVCNLRMRTVQTSELSSGVIHTMYTITNKISSKILNMSKLMRFKIIIVLTLLQVTSIERGKKNYTVIGYITKISTCQMYMVYSVGKI